METLEVKKLNNQSVEVKYIDGSSKVHHITRVYSRRYAIEIAEELTRAELSKSNAFERLHIFKNEFARLRNYEIETYIENISNKYYRIDEPCPLNGTSWFN